MALAIDKKIVGYSVAKSEEASTETPASAPPATVIPMPLLLHERPDIVEGRTYKIKPPVGSSAIYITVNDIVEPGTLKRRPIEVFINTKDTSHFQWITGLTRVISALLRKPGEFIFIFDELQHVYDPQGGYWHNGEMVPSVVAHIGMILKEHCRHLGLVEVPVLSSSQIEVLTQKAVEAEAAGVKGTKCAKCAENKVVVLDGCATCLNCGDSKCG